MALFRAHVVRPLTRLCLIRQPSLLRPLKADLLEGALLVRPAYSMNDADQELRPEYREAERTVAPYPGLDVFLRTVKRRDFAVHVRVF